MFGTVSDFSDMCSCTGLKPIRPDDIDGQNDFTSAGACRCKNFSDCFKLSRFVKRLAHRHARRGKECIGHATTDDQRVNLANQMGEHIDFARHFRSANQRYCRPFRHLQRLSKRLNFGQHERSGRRRQKIGDGDSRCMSPVRAGKRIVDEYIAEFRQFCAERRAIGFFSRVELQILTHQYLTSRETGCNF